MDIKKLAIIVLAAAQFLMAQVSYNFNFSTYVDDNVFRSPEPTADVLTDVGIHLHYQPQNSNMLLKYEGDFYLYNKLSERNFSLHSFGLSSYTSFGRKDQHSFYYGADVDLRLNGDTYNYYNYGQLYLYGSFFLNLQKFILRTGYNFRYREYSNLPELSNSRHYLFIQANKSLPTRTTLIVEADYGYKSFAGQQAETFIGRRGRMNVSYYTEPATIPSLSHVILLARVAQSLHPKIGMFVQYKKQISLSDQTDYLNADDYYQDEELFDDPFSYEMERFTAQITWLLPAKTSLKISGSSYDKNYISEQAYISADDSVGLGGVRTDNGKTLNVSLEKSFNLNKTWIKTLTFSLYYVHLINESNSYWYDYKNSVISGSISWKF
ncbi:hypothetical protein ACX8XP_06800 [Calditrichota bacterium LG25]